MTKFQPDILAPLPLEEFFYRSWEQSHCHIARGDSNYFSDVVSIQDINTLLSTRSVYFPEVQLVHHEKEIPISDYADDQRLVNASQLMQPMQAGATLVWSQAQKEFSGLAYLCRVFTQIFQMRCQTNLYLSPAGNQGFRSHYDTHDVFILQVNGSKTFRFYPSDIQLPFPDDHYDPEQNPHTDVKQEVILNAGDTLYIPRGLVHDALAHIDGPSLHITLGAFPVVIRDLLQEAIQVAAEGHVNLRKALLSETYDSPDPEGDLAQWLTRAITPENINEARSRLADQVALGSAAESHILASTTEALELHTPLIVNKSAIINVERMGQQVKIRTHGQVVCFQEPMGQAVEWLTEKTTFQPRDLPGLAVNQQMALCGHLLDNGVIEK